MSRFPTTGALRQAVVLQAPVDADTADGGATRTFVDVATVWAAVAPVTGIADFVADHAEDLVTYRVAIRWRSDLQAGMRFALGSRLFVIRSVHDIGERRRFLLCRCEEGGG